MKIMQANKGLVILLTTFGLIAASQSVAADSASSWGRWADGEEMAVVMTRTESGTSLNHSLGCQYESCANDYKSYEQDSAILPEETQVACVDGTSAKPCNLGPKVSQH